MHNDHNIMRFVEKLQREKSYHVGMANHASLIPL